MNGFPAFGTAGLGYAKPVPQDLLYLIVHAPPVPPWFDVPVPVPFPADGTEDEKGRWHAARQAERDLTWPSWWATQQLLRSGKWHENSKT